MSFGGCGLGKSRNRKRRFARVSSRAVSLFLLFPFFGLGHLPFRGLGFSLLPFFTSPLFHLFFRRYPYPRHEYGVNPFVGAGFLDRQAEIGTVKFFGLA